ncbi:MAG: site-2 protease family protein, partial [Candidatus Omnitrophica bacterium]|nr:site-2 protease family protein [Candidatus Omnitrophota bacterium]
IHGELDKFQDNLRQARLIDNENDWIGGKAILVQVGDTIDRGSKSRETYEFLADLQKQARLAGGEVVRLLGNHELMVLQGYYQFTNFDQPEKLAGQIRRDILSGDVKAAFVFGDRIFTHGDFEFSTIQRRLVEEIAGEKSISPNAVTLSELAEKMNQFLIAAVKIGDFSHEIFGANGIFWSRNNYKYFKNLPGSRLSWAAKQIVGHTPGGKVRYTDSLGLINVDAGLCGNLGGNQAFLEIDDNKIKIIAKDFNGDWSEKELGDFIEGSSVFVASQHQKSRSSSLSLPKVSLSAGSFLAAGAFANFFTINVFWIIGILFISIVVHEFAHAWVAYLYGDTTAKDQGRLTLNPLVHIDLIGTIIIPLATYYLFGFIIGWAKPVPINYQLLKKKHGLFATAFAGPLSNLLLASALALVFNLGGFTAAGLGSIILMSIFINLILAVLNLLPIWPLDGSHMIEASLKSPRAIRIFENYSRFGLLILVAFLVLGGVSLIVIPLAKAFYLLLGLPWLWPALSVKRTAAAANQRKAGVLSVYSSVWKAAVHLGLIIVVANFTYQQFLAYFGTQLAAVYVFGPSFLVMAGIFLLWRDYQAWKQKRPLELFYIYAPKGVPLSRYLAVQRVLLEPFRAKEDKTAGGFSDIRMISVFSRIITHPLTTIAFVAVGALIAATGVEFTIASTLIGALSGLFAPYLLNILWNFFWSYIVKNDYRQRLLRDYTDYKAAKGQWSAEQIKVFSQIETAEKQIEASGILSGFWQRALAGYLRISSVFPALFGALEFALIRVQIFFWGAILAQAITPIILPNLADKPLLALFNLGHWQDFVIKWHLPYTFGGLLTIGLIVMLLKLFSLRLVYFRNQLQKILAKSKPGALDAREIFANFDKFTDSQKLQLKKLLKQRLINPSGRPELTVLLAKKLGVKRRLFSIIGYSSYYLIPSLIALVMILSAPLAGLLYPLYYVSIRLKPDFSQSHPYLAIWALKGKEFWVSFWHLLIIRVEIGAVLGSGQFLEEHPYLKDVGGRQLSHIADRLEGPTGAISWGSHIFGLIDPQASLTQGVHDLLTDSDEVNIADRIREDKLASELNAISNPDNFAQGLEKLSETSSIYWAGLDTAAKERVLSGLDAAQRQAVEDTIKRTLSLSLSDYDVDAIVQAAAYRRIPLDSLYIMRQLTGEVILEQPTYLDGFNTELDPLFIPWIEKYALKPTEIQKESIRDASKKLEDFINSHGGKFDKIEVVAFPHDRLGANYKLRPGFELGNLEKVFVSEKAEEINEKLLLRQGLKTNTAGFGVRRLDKGMNEYIVETLAPEQKVEVHPVRPEAI